MIHHYKPDLTRHLLECNECFETFARHSPAAVLAGRPAPGLATVLPDEAEYGIQTFLHTCLRFLLSGGGVFRIAGDGLSERLLYWIVSVGVSRLRTRGLTGQICGQVFNSSEAPERPPGSRVAVLLEAPVYDLPPRWMMGPCLNILIGHAADWRALGVRPDWTVRVEDEAAVRRRLAQAVSRIERVVRGSEDGRWALLLNANSMDAPGDPWSGDFVAIGEEKERWVSIESGQWLARDILPAAEAVDVPEVLLPRYRRVRDLRDVRRANDGESTIA